MGDTIVPVVMETHSHVEEHTVDDIGFDDIAIRLVCANDTVRKVTLHWSTPTAWQYKDEGKQVAPALQFHQAELPIDPDKLAKASVIFQELVARVEKITGYEIAFTKAQEENDGQKG